MTITVKLIGALRHISGKSQLSIKCEESTSLKELINTIAEETPELKQSLLSQQPDDSRANALILVNGREISVLNGLETKLNDGDEVVFVPVVHGG
jgi:molybdopterin synthase sulfur carrier subunit